MLSILSVQSSRVSECRVPTDRPSDWCCLSFSVCARNHYFRGVCRALDRLFVILQVRQLCSMFYSKADPALVEDFVQRLPDREISMAQLQGHFVK